MEKIEIKQSATLDFGDVDEYNDNLTRVQKGGLTSNAEEYNIEEDDDIDVIYADNVPNPEKIICIAISDTPASEYAFQLAMDNYVHCEKDLVVLLNVRELPSLKGFYFAAPFMYFDDVRDEMEETFRQQSGYLLAKYVDKIKQKYGAKVQALSLRGNAAEELIIRIKMIQPDLVIIGGNSSPTLNVGFLSRLFSSSVSESVINNVDCPVLIARKPGNSNHP